VPDAKEKSDIPLRPKDGAYLLGAVAIACCVRLIVLASGDSDVSGEHFAWLALCVVAAAFSSAWVVLAGLKAAESRWRGGQ
jgi:hypothetical protein